MQSPDQSSTADTAEPVITGAAATASKPVVTLFESYAAGAADIGAKVAERLQVPFWQQAFSSEYLEEQEERREKESALSRVFNAVGRSYGTFEVADVPDLQRDQNELVLENNRKVWEQASEGGVMIGRNGAVILAGRPNALHVRLDAPLEDRLRRAAAASNISLDRAAKRQKREDAVRAEMSIELYGWDPRLDDHYDLMLNTGLLGLDTCVEIIVAASRIKGGQPAT